MAVKVIARSRGKKIAKTGINKVPSPKPEKKDKSEASNETVPIKIYSIVKISQIKLTKKIKYKKGIRIN